MRGPIVDGVATNADYKALLGLINADLSVDANYEAVGAKLEIGDFIKYMLVNYVAGNWDWASHNWYATFNRKRPDGRWRFHSWDAEHTWRDPGEDFTGKNDPEGPTHMQQQLAQNAEYRLRFADAVHRHLFNGGQLTTARIQQTFEKRLGNIHEAIRGESARWGDNYDISPPRTRRDWLREVARILGYVPAFPNNSETAVPASPVLPGRPSAVIGQFRARGWYPNAAAGGGWGTEAPEFNQHGGNVQGGFSLSVSKTPVDTAGIIYYTTNGSDRRVAVTGAVANAAQMVQGSITLTRSVGIKARVLNEGEWSPLTEAFFTVDTQPASSANLVVSELMYHPPAPSSAEIAGGYGDESDFEFVELLNVGLTTVDLTGLMFTAGVGFDFNTLPPEQRLLPRGSRLVVAGNVTAFRARYGNAVNVVGPYTGNLSNSGERLTLSGAGDAVICDFTYDDSEPWPTAADGAGYSLVLNNSAGASPGLPSSWRASASIGGAAGLADSAPLPERPLADDDGDGVGNLLDYATGGRPQTTVKREWLTIEGQTDELRYVSLSTCSRHGWLHFCARVECRSFDMVV